MAWVVLAVIAAVFVSGAALLAVRALRSYRQANELVPGQPGTAPGSWAGSHDPEALLHRRIRDALRALRANQAFDDDGALLEIRVVLEQEALALDQRLQAIANLPPRLHAEPLAQATKAVETIEEVVASSIGMSEADAAPRLRAALEQVKERTALVGQAWDELTAGSPAAEPIATAPAEPVVAQPAEPAVAPAPETEPPTAPPT